MNELLLGLLRLQIGIHRTVILCVWPWPSLRTCRRRSFTSVCCQGTNRLYESPPRQVWSSFQRFSPVKETGSPFSYCLFPYGVQTPTLGFLPVRSLLHLHHPNWSMAQSVTTVVNRINECMNGLYSTLLCKLLKCESSIVRGGGHHRCYRGGLRVGRSGFGLIP